MTDRIDDQAPPNSLVARVMRTYELLSEQPVSAAELGRHLGMNRSTALRLLTDMVDTGYVRRDPQTKRYSTVTPKFLALVAHPALRQDHSHAVNRTLASIRDETGDSTVLGVPAEQEMIYLTYYATRHVVGLSEGVGTARPIYCSALGKAYLSGLDPAALEAKLGQLTLFGGSEHAATSLDDLRERVATARRDGYAMDLEETFDDVRCVAVPLWFDHSLVGAAGITGPATRLPVTRLRELGTYLKKKLTDL